MNLLGDYLQQLKSSRSFGSVNETFGYGILQNALNVVGRGLKPSRVHCVIHPQNSGAGIPDGGLFTSDQAKQDLESLLLKRAVPSRGVIEVKGTGDDLDKIAASPQVAKYLEHYGQILVTNYRDFLLMTRGAKGEPVRLESFKISETEAEFWSIDPARVTDEQSSRFEDYLRRVIQQKAPMASPAEVAWFLASYAREAKARVEDSNIDALAPVRTALEQALGLQFVGERGDHFFRSTLVQTLFYGVFSAWVLWHKSNPTRTDRFDWKSAGWQLHVPVIRVLFEQVATRTTLEPLRLIEVLDWTGDALNRVERPVFFEKFNEAHAVQYFYEPFLQAYDPELRKELGVWYTPPEIVQYMVARVDAVLREELKVADGLADPNVYVLDPCCGTGAYLVEVLRRIERSLRENGADALTAYQVKKAAMERVFGFEILPAPFVVAHLQLGLLLQSLGAPFSDDPHERAAVYLTNALTGWEPPKDPKQHLIFHELEVERDRAAEIKQQKPILVILGNPPYNGYAGVSIGEERDLTLAYRTTKKAPAPQGQGLNDLYVRFFRMAERRIVEMTGRGVVCFISNYSWLDGLSFTGMRERYLEVFDKIWIDCLNGDKYKTGKLTPDGKPDPSVFSTELNREGIQVGTAIATLAQVRSGLDQRLRFRQFWGRSKRDDLVSSVNDGDNYNYEELAPQIQLGLPFRTSSVSTGYSQWPNLPALFPAYFAGVQTKRDDFVVDIDEAQLCSRMHAYFDPAVSDRAIAQRYPRAMEQTQRFDPTTTRKYLVKRGFKPDYLVPFAYRPLDARWVYWEPETRLLGEKSPAYFPHVCSGNVWMISQQKPRGEWSKPQFLRMLGCLDLVDRCASCFPLFLHDPLLSSVGNSAGANPELATNLSTPASGYLAGMGCDEPELFHHCFAMQHSGLYASDNDGALRQDWPRIPLPATSELLLASAALGKRVAALLDTESPVTGVTTGAILPELRSLGAVSRVGGGPLDPTAGDLAVTAGWGHAGQGGVTMPAKGKSVQREYTHLEREALGDKVALLGETTRDVFPNDVAYWRNVPEKVWSYHIGGYQVIKKWLSYRERPLLGRDLRPDEAQYVTEMVRRIAALLLLGPELDANYEAIKQNTYAWPREAS